MLQKSLKQKEAKNLKQKEGNFFVSFEKQSKNQAKCDAVSLFSLRSKKNKTSENGTP